MTAHPAHQASTRLSPRRLAAATTVLAVSGLALAPAHSAGPLAAESDLSATGGPTARDDHAVVTAGDSVRVDILSNEHVE